MRRTVSKTSKKIFTSSFQKQTEGFKSRANQQRERAAATERS